jgi:hypothetical protein
MSYDVGTHIDLRYLNKKEVSNQAPQLRETATNLMDVGTQISFKLINKKLASARQIPVVFA